MWSLTFGLTKVILMGIIYLRSENLTFQGWSNCWVPWKLALVSETGSWEIYVVNLEFMEPTRGHGTNQGHTTMMCGYIIGEHVFEIQVMTSVLESYLNWDMWTVGVIKPYDLRVMPWPLRLTSDLSCTV